VIDRVLTQASSLFAEHELASPTGMPLSLQLGAAVTPVALDVLAYASMSSGTLRDAVMLLCQFEPYRLGFARCQVHEDGLTASVEMQVEGRWASQALQVEAAFAGWIEFGRWITASASKPVRIEFAHGPQAPVAQYERFFQCPVMFERGQHAVHIDPDLFNKPLAAANPDVCRLMREEMLRRIERFAKGDQFIVRLERAIETCLAHGAPSAEQVAAAMGLEPRQLRTQAGVAGTNLSTAVDAVRRRLAEQYLASGVALVDISQRLGYSEQSAFTRACVRWFGMSPGKLRPGEAQASTTTS
jgi:AraC-like DNA-binding protein